MAVAVLHSRALSGFDAPPVEVEVHLAGGLPAFNLVGLPETEVKESRDRVRAALQNARFDFPAARLPLTSRPPIYRRNPAVSTCPSRWESSLPPDRFQRTRSSITNLPASWH